jgi:hypothetical protein
VPKHHFFATAQPVYYPQHKVTGVFGFIRHPGVLKAGVQFYFNGSLDVG